ncbi:hypothetical protein Syun_007744 [Stephania yunnanensis]|uniref:Uncharacterized protein n=1 Tax=Stephania yunnanensis TaxID=152371 RepID=A0AAP0L0H3_9MAGN
MAESTSITLATRDHLQQPPQQQLEPIIHGEQYSLRQRTPAGSTYIVIDKTLAGTANLVKLLPCGTVIAFQALSPSFSNCGLCQTPANKYLTIALILLCALSCCFFSFTDSFIDMDGKLYYGIATFKGFYIFNSGVRPKDESSIPTSTAGMRSRKEEMNKYKITFVDFIHALFSCLVFMALALGDPYVHRCFFDRVDENTKEWLANLPLGVGFLTSLVFIIFPTSRKGIGYSDHRT